MSIQPKLFSLIESFASPDAAVHLHEALRAPLSSRAAPPPPPSAQLTSEQFEASLALIATSGSQVKQHLSRYLSRENLTMSPDKFTVNSIHSIFGATAEQLKTLNQAWQVQRQSLKHQAAFVFRDFRPASRMNPVQFEFVMQQLKTHTPDEMLALLPATSRPVLGGLTDLFTPEDFATYQHQVAHFQTKSIDVAAVFKGYQEGTFLNTLQYRLVVNLIERKYALKKCLASYIGKTDVRALFNPDQRQDFRVSLGERNTEQVDHSGKRVYKFEMDGENAFEEIEEGPENELHYVELSRKLGFDPRSIESARSRFKLFQAQNPGLIQRHDDYLYVQEKGRILLIPQKKPLERLKQVVFLEEGDATIEEAIEKYEESESHDAYIIAPDGDVEKFHRFTHTAGYKKMRDTAGYDARSMIEVENHYLKHLNSLESIGDYDCLLAEGGRVLFSPSNEVANLRKQDGDADHKKARNEIRQIKFYDPSGAPLEGDNLKHALGEFLKAFKNKDFAVQIRPYTHFKIDFQTGKMECSNPSNSALKGLTVNFHYYTSLPADKKKKTSTATPLKSPRHSAADVSTPGLGEALP